MASQVNKPVHTERIGAVVASVWENDTENGPRCKVTFQRIYRSGDEWKHTQSFSRNDLLNLAKLADIVDSYILRRQMQPAEA